MRFKKRDTVLAGRFAAKVLHPSRDGRTAVVKLDATKNADPCRAAFGLQRRS